VSLGVEKYTSVSASVDGTHLVATVANPTANLWRVPILERTVDEGDVRPFPVPTVNAAGPQFANASLFYLSSGAAGNGLWRYRDGEAVEIWRGVDSPLVNAPGISSDGQGVALALRRNGKLRLHVLSSDGAELRPLTAAVDIRGAVSWSPDRAWIAAGGSDVDGDGLFKIPVDGGSPVRVVNERALDPLWSPDGSLIVYTGPNVGSQAPLLAIEPNGKPVSFPPIQVRREGSGGRARFLPDGSGLIYMQGFGLSQNFWLLDLATKGRRQVTKLNQRDAMRGFDISPDGKQIVFDRSRDNSDIVLIDLPSPARR
jgi:Tol biopolymer transport system component